MCLTVPRKVIEGGDGLALVQGGRRVLTTLVGPVQKGDMVLVQANLIVEKISAKQALEMKELLVEEDDE